MEIENPYYILFIIFLIIVFIYSCYSCCQEYFNSEKIIRPNHPKWYKDIPDTHPEVLDLIQATSRQSKIVPTYTPNGFKLIKTPKDIQDYLLNVSKTVDRIPEKSNNIFRRTSSGLPPYILPIPETEKSKIQNQLLPIMEEWSGLKLKPTSAYGPREYRRGSSLRMHVDTQTTHIISGILHIDSENLNSDWPVVVINRKGERESIFMKPGELLLYESASLPHSREQPLNGDFYVNMFIHFMPIENTNG